MQNESRIPFTDTFFLTEHRVHYFTLGSDPDAVFEHFKRLDLSNADVCRLLDATGIDVRNQNWSVGELLEPTVICHRLYPKHTAVLVQDHKPGSRFAVFSEPSTCRSIAAGVSDPLQ